MIVILGIIGSILITISFVYIIGMMIYWNEPEDIWKFSFGDNIGKKLYNWNIKVNNIYKNFWR